MATPSEKLAGSLEVLRRPQVDGAVAIRSRDISRTHRERLTANGFLQEVFKGWYTPSRPDEPKGESTAWYTAFWRFCAAYLTERFGEAWCLSPGQSLLLHVGNHTVPRQLVVRASKGRNHVTDLPHETRLVDVKASIPAEKDMVILDGLRLFSVPTALIAAGPGATRLTRRFGARLKWTLLVSCSNMVPVVGLMVGSSWALPILQVHAHRV